MSTTSRELSLSIQHPNSFFIGGVGRSRPAGEALS